jgi:ribonuclease VapC
MIVDSSAIVAMLMREPEHDRLRDTLLRAERQVRMGSPTYVEASVVIDKRRSVVGSRALDDLLEEYEIEIVAFTPEHARIAREAYRDFGKGSGHPAKLNYGDAMAYAIARLEREQLLFVGEDFVHTDISAA